MTTLSELVGQGRLIKIDGELSAPQQEERLIYATPLIVEWLENGLPGLASSVYAPDSPLEQVDALFEEYLAGLPMHYGHQFKRIWPGELGVWEMRTPDIRIFGWFPSRNCFVATRANDASHIKDHNLYGGIRNEVVRDRESLNLLDGAYVTGDRIEDVVST